MSDFRHIEYDARGRQVVLTAKSFDELVKLTVAERKKKGRVVDYNKVYNELSRRYGKGPVKNLAATNKDAKRLTWEQTLNGAKAVLKNVQGKVVSQAEINRRGEICSHGNSGSQCPMLEHVSGCKRCGLAKEAISLFKATQEFFGKNTYQVPAHLKKTYCGVCGCAHAALLPAKNEDFLPDTPKEAALRPSFCWVNKDKSNA